MAFGAKASNTRKLEFVPMDEQASVVGRFGYWVKDGEKEFISYEPYKKVIK